MQGARVLQNITDEDDAHFHGIYVTVILSTNITLGMNDCNLLSWACDRPWPPQFGSAQRDPMCYTITSTLENYHS